jgi:hypothetical protein
LCTLISVAHEAQPAAISVGAAEFRRHDHAEQAQFAELADHAIGNGLVAVPLRRVRREHFARELAGSVADHALLFGQKTVDHG